MGEQNGASHYSFNDHDDSSIVMMMVSSLVHLLDDHDDVDDDDGDADAVQCRCRCGGSCS